ncbi:hydrolase [Saccharibacillus sp. O16]|nr:hydrolase [Saccharibacillus sp. O16]
MTLKRYYESAYLREWTASIADLEEREDGLYVRLDETAFYPEGGGQPGDTGRIGEALVLDTVMEKGDVLQKIDTRPGNVGDSVLCTLDWERRFDHMQQHSGQHLLSATCLDLLDAPTLSFHLGEDYCTIDVDRAAWTADELEAVEQEVNRRIVRNLPITSYTVSPQEAAALPLVKAPSVEGDVRIVEIKGIEYNACGGTHVASTAELGMLKLLRAEKQKGHLRLVFKTGFRALNEFVVQTRILADLSSRLSTPKEELVERVDKWLEDDRRKQSERQALQQQLDKYVAHELLEEAVHRGGAVARLFEQRAFKELQSLAAVLTAQTTLPVLLGSLTESKLLLAHGGQADLSCGAKLREVLPEYGGRGGGNERLAQASFGSEAELRACYERLLSDFQ